jgi:hypothetical protein
MITARMNSRDAVLHLVNDQACHKSGIMSQNSKSHSRTTIEGMDGKFGLRVRLE